MSNDLPPRLKQLYALLPRDKDVPILDIYRAMFPHGTPAELRYAQQYMGTHITKLNRRLRRHKEVVKPGRLKGTYRLQALR